MFKILEQRGAQFVRRDGNARLALRLAEIDADGEGPHKSDVVVALDGEALPLDARLESGIDRFQKIVAVRLDVKADQIGAEQAIEKLALPGADAEGFRVGPGNMPEDSYANVRARLLDHSGKQREVIVLDEKQGVFDAFHFGEHGVGEFAVGVLIALPIGGAENRARVGDVA